MTSRPLTLLAATALAAVMGAALVSADADTVTRRDAARLQAKIDKINRSGAGARPATPVRTPVSELEVNSYLRYEMNGRLPVGVSQPSVSLLGAGHVTGRATVDLTQVAKSRKTGSLFDPYSYLSGSLPVTADGVLTAKNGIATFSLQSAAVSGIPVPVWLLQDIVTSYTKSPAIPGGVALDRPFPLPAGIREIQLDRGQAIVIQ